MKVTFTVKSVDFAATRNDPYIVHAQANVEVASRWTTTVTAADFVVRVRRGGKRASFEREKIRDEFEHEAGAAVRGFCEALAKSLATPD